MCTVCKCLGFILRLHYLFSVYWFFSFLKRFSFSFLVTNPFSPLSCRTSQIHSYMQNRRMEMGPSFHPATPYMAQITAEARDPIKRRRTGRKFDAVELGCSAELGWYVLTWSLAAFRYVSHHVWLLRSWVRWRVNISCLAKTYLLMFMKLDTD